MSIWNSAYGVSFLKWIWTEYISECGINNKTVELNQNNFWNKSCDPIDSERNHHVLTWSGFRILIICTFKSYCNRSNETSDSRNDHGLGTTLQKLSIFSLFQILMTELMTFCIFWQEWMEPTFNTIFNTIETFR